MTELELAIQLCRNQGKYGIIVKNNDSGFDLHTGKDRPAFVRDVGWTYSDDVKRYGYMPTCQRMYGFFSSIPACGMDPKDVLINPEGRIEPPQNSEICTNVAVYTEYWIRIRYLFDHIKEQRIEKLYSESRNHSGWVTQLDNQIKMHNGKKLSKKWAHLQPISTSEMADELNIIGQYVEGAIREFQEIHTDIQSLYKKILSDQKPRRTNEGTGICLHN